MCEPEGMSLQMGGLHPRASLYEKPVNLEAAKQVGNERRAGGCVVGCWRMAGWAPACTRCRST